MATEQVSAGSLLRALLVPSSRARAASLAGTSTTCSPAATSSWAIPRPRPLAPSTAQRRWGQTAAQASLQLIVSPECGIIWVSGQYTVAAIATTLGVRL